MRKAILIAFCLLLAVLVSGCSLTGGSKNPASTGQETEVAPTGEEQAGTPADETGDIQDVEPADMADDTDVVQESETATTTDTTAKSYTLAEIALHGTPEDCWLAISGKVYNVSNFDAQHGGGKAVYEGCGKDATTLFETRPMGSKTPHSEKARGFLPNFEIGVLASETTATTTAGSM